MNTEECHNFIKLVILYVVEKVLLILGSLITVQYAKLTYNVDTTCLRIFMLLVKMYLLM